MTRKGNRPEELWTDATFEQVADLREWIQSRMKERHADSIAAWLLSLDTDEPVVPHKRQVAFFRQILDEYGPPRPAADDSDSSSGSSSEAPPEPSSEPPTETDSDDPEATAQAWAQPAGRYRRA